MVQHQPWKVLVQKPVTLNIMVMVTAKLIPKYETYGDKEVVKFECVGHYQKRVGTLLRKLKKDKGLGELTAPLIDKLRNYFGIAL